VWFRVWGFRVSGVRAQGLGFGVWFDLVWCRVWGLIWFGSSRYLGGAGREAAPQRAEHLVQDIWFRTPGSGHLLQDIWFRTPASWTTGYEPFERQRFRLQRWGRCRAKRKRNTLKGFKTLHLKAKAGTWP